MRHESDVEAAPVDMLKLQLQNVESQMDIDEAAERIILLLNERQALQAENAAIQLANGDLRQSIRDQDSEIQALRAEITRLTTLLQVRQRPDPMLVKALNCYEATDRFAGDLALWGYAREELRKLRETVQP